MLICPKIDICCDKCGKPSLTLKWFSAKNLDEPINNKARIKRELLSRGWSIDQEGWQRCPRCSGCTDPTKVFIEDHEYTWLEIRQAMRNGVDMTPRDS